MITALKKGRSDGQEPILQLVLSHLPVLSLGDTPQFLLLACFWCFIPALSHYTLLACSNRFIPKRFFIDCIESKILSRSSILIDQEGTNKVDFRYLELDQVESHSSTVKLLGVELALMSRSSCRCSSLNNNLNPQDKIGIIHVVCGQVVHCLACYRNSLCWGRQEQELKTELNPRSACLCCFIIHNHLMFL